MPTGFTTVSSSHLTDATGAVVANATISFQPCSTSGVALSFRVNGNGQAMSQPVTATVTTGAFTVTLADTTLTSPVNICYAVTVIDNVSGKSLLGPGYLIQPSGSTWNFDAFVPNVANLALIQTGPAGPTGATGPANTLAIGTVTTGAAGTSASATITGTAPSQTLNLTIPTGPAGPTGGSLGTTTPLIAAGTGAAGISTFSSAADHVHPTEVTGKAIAPASVTATGLVLDSSTKAINPYNYLNLVTAVWDSLGNLLWGYTANGALLGAASLPAGSTSVGLNVTLPGNLTVAGTVVDATTKLISPYNYLGLVSGVWDSIGNIAWGTTSKGVVISSSSTASTVAATPVLSTQTQNPVAPNVDSLSYYSASDGTVQQVYKVVPVYSSSYAPSTGAVITETDSAVKLTSGTVNDCTVPNTNQDNSWVRYLSTPHAGGSSTLMKANRWGQHQIANAVAYLKQFALNLVLIGGQSLSNGYNAGSILSTTQPFSNVMPGGGILQGGNYSGGPAYANPTSLVPLVETLDVTGDHGESIASNFANTLYQWLMQDGVLMPFCMASYGYDGQSIGSQQRGSATYANGQSLVTSLKSLSASAGYASFGARALLYVDGETDWSATTFDTSLSTVQSQFETDTVAITGQADASIPMIICQTSGFSEEAGSTPDTTYSPYLQLQASVNNPGKIVLTGPSYFLPYNSIHMYAAGYRRQGGYFAKAFLRQVIQNQPWRPLSPRKIVRDGANIFVDFWVPVAPLVIDTITVTPPSFYTGGIYGFEYIDGGTPPAITSVAVIGPTTVKITLASVPTGSNKRLRYAYSFTASVLPGPSSGPRGCLRDSDTTTDYYGEALPNWCVHFNLACN